MTNFNTNYPKKFPIMTMITIAITLAISLFNCSNRDDRLVVGVIAPSTDWLPLALALEENIINEEDLIIHYFSSGWEVNEAIIAGRIDVAIMPFTYAWKGVSENKDIRIISFFERESDGIVTGKEFENISELHGKKVGVLRASTLDIFLHMISEKYEFQPEIVYFRTPTEMAAALQSGSVDALSYYVPQIFRLGERFKPVYWYGEDFMQHPCCDIIATVSAISTKRNLLTDFLKGLDKGINFLNEHPETGKKVMMKKYSLSAVEAEQTLNYTGFKLSLDGEGKYFELLTALKMKELGYLRRVPEEEEVFFDELLQDIFSE